MAKRSRIGLKCPSNCDAPIAQLAEAADLKSAQCRFESDWGHGKGLFKSYFNRSGLL